VAIEADVVPGLLRIMSLREDPRATLEATWAISNLLKSAQPEQLAYLLGQECVPLLCSLLTYEKVNVVQVALDSIKSVLDAGAKSNEAGDNRNLHLIEAVNG